MKGEFTDLPETALLLIAMLVPAEDVGVFALLCRRCARVCAAAAHYFWLDRAAARLSRDGAAAVRRAHEEAAPPSHQTRAARQAYVRGYRLALLPDNVVCAPPIMSFSGDGLTVFAFQCRATAPHELTYELTYIRGAAAVTDRGQPWQRVPLVAGYSPQHGRVLVSHTGTCVFALMGNAGMRGALLQYNAASHTYDAHELHPVPDGRFLAVDDNGRVYTAVECADGRVSVVIFDRRSAPLLHLAEIARVAVLPVALPAGQRQFASARVSPTGECMTLRLHDDPDPYLFYFAPAMLVRALPRNVEVATPRPQERMRRTCFYAAFSEDGATLQLAYFTAVRGRCRNVVSMQSYSVRVPRAEAIRRHARASTSAVGGCALKSKRRAPTYEIRHSVDDGGSVCVSDGLVRVNECDLLQSRQWNVLAVTHAGLLWTLTHEQRGVKQRFDDMLSARFLTARYCDVH